MDIECELRRLRLWQAESPSLEALASPQPFCYDTLELHQWLQFIFLPRMYELVELRQPLPAACAIAPMAEEFYKSRLAEVQPLLVQLRRMDRLFE